MDAAVTHYDILIILIALTHTITSPHCHHTAIIVITVDSWLSAWSTQKMDKRDLYKSVSEVLKRDGKESLALRYVHGYG